MDQLARLRRELDRGPALSLFICYVLGASSNYATLRLSCGIVGVSTIALATAGLLFVIGVALAGG